LCSRSTDIIVEEANFTNNTMVFSFQRNKSFWSRSQTLFEVGAGAQSFRCLELEPEPEI